MSDEHLTPARPPGVGDPSVPPPVLAVAPAEQQIPPVAPTQTPAPGPRWLPNVLLLLGLSLIGVVGAAALIAHDQFAAARLLFGILACVALAVALRPLFVRGRRKVLRALAFVGILVGFLIGSALISYALFFSAYVVPTGAMALGIRGYHREIECPECGHRSPVNYSAETDPGRDGHDVITSCVCGNCLRHIALAKNDPADGLAPPPAQPFAHQRGDRILVSRFWTSPGDGLSRFAVVAFWYPPRAEQAPVPKYVCRIAGLPGETLAISHGRLFRSRDLTYNDPVDPHERWRPDHLHSDDPKALALFKEGKFQIVRKDPEILLALRRLVHDNDHQAADLKGVLPPRWSGGGWVADGTAFRAGAGGAGVGWLRYRHVLRPPDWPERSDPNYAGRVEEIKRRQPAPELIRDFLAYNTFGMNGRPETSRGDVWVGDLMLECRVQADKAAGEFWLELSKGEDRFRARFDLVSGKCTLFRHGADAKLRELQSAPTRVNQAGEHLLRLANVDERLTLWVDDDLPFGDGVAYDPPRKRGPTVNDLEPASVGSQGATVRVRGLKLYRDTYYGTDARGPDLGFGVEGRRERFWSDPMAWGPLHELPVRTFYVHPGHYFVLGDNSAQSSDSRDWGLVPERLLIGRVLLIYLPLDRSARVR